MTKVLIVGDCSKGLRAAVESTLEASGCEIVTDTSTEGGEGLHGLDYDVSSSDECYSVVDSELQRVLSIADEHMDTYHLIKPSTSTLKHMSDVFCGQATGMYPAGRQYFHWLYEWATTNGIEPPLMDYTLTTYYLAFVYYNYKLSKGEEL